MTVAINVGTRFPAYATSMGRVLLANLPSDELDDYLDRHEREAFTPHTITDRGELVAELAKVRGSGLGPRRPGARGGAAIHRCFRSATAPGSSSPRSTCRPAHAAAKPPRSSSTCCPCCWRRRPRSTTTCASSRCRTEREARRSSRRVPWRRLCWSTPTAIANAEAAGRTDRRRVQHRGHPPREVRAPPHPAQRGVGIGVGQRVNRSSAAARRAPERGAQRRRPRGSVPWHPWAARCARRHRRGKAARAA